MLIRLRLHAAVPQHARTAAQQQPLAAAATTVSSAAPAQRSQGCRRAAHATRFVCAAAELASNLLDEALAAVAPAGVLQADSAHQRSSAAGASQADDLISDNNDDSVAGDAADEDDGAEASTSGRDAPGRGGADEFPELQLALPPPQHSRVKTARYISSAVTIKSCPPPRLPEFAVIGRSNVGKSSLINMLTLQKGLAKVSKEPGKTRCINHFLINEKWYLVDLPGYGYAKLSQDTRASFERFTAEYFAQRASLAMVFLLIDSSVPPQKVDLDYACKLAEAGVAFCIVFTKADKRKKGGAAGSANMKAFKRSLLVQGFSALPPSVVTSADTGLGKGQLLGLIASLREAFEKSGRLKEAAARQPAPAAAAPEAEP